MVGECGQDSATGGAARPWPTATCPLRPLGGRRNDEGRKIFPRGFSSELCFNGLNNAVEVWELPALLL
jgi:hypothetical protein